MTLLPKAINRFNPFHIKISVALFKETEQTSLNVYRETQKIPNSPKIPEAKEELKHSIP